MSVRAPSSRARGPSRAKAGNPRLRVRRLRATALVALLVCTPAAASAASSRFCPEETPPFVGDSARQEERASGIAQLISSGSKVFDEMPEGFEEELVSMAGRREAVFDRRHGVAGFCTSASDRDSFETLARELEGKGWTRVPSGWPSCGSFSKGWGRFRWAFVSCVDTGGSTSAVVRYTTAEKKGELP